jgi:uncharacterized membrane protein
MAMFVEFLQAVFETVCCGCVCAGLLWALCALRKSRIPEIFNEITAGFIRALALNITVIVVDGVVYGF